MTDFYPIDKPTEPGWYWCEIVGREGLVVVRIAHRNYGDCGPMWLYMPSGAACELSRYSEKHQFFGPAIQPPQKYEAKMDPERGDVVNSRAVRDFKEGELISISVTELEKMGWRWHG